MPELLYVAGQATWSSCDPVTRKVALALFAKQLERPRLGWSSLSFFHWLFRNRRCVEPNWTTVVRKLKRPGVMLQIRWEEHSAEQPDASQSPYRVATPPLVPGAGAGPALVAPPHAGRAMRAAHAR